MKEKYRVTSMEKVERGMKSNGCLSFEYSNSELEKMKRDDQTQVTLYFSFINDIKSR
jgi:hypothetical protein